MLTTASGWVYALAAQIPAPGIREFSLGPLTIRLYALALLLGIAVAMWITLKRWIARGGDPDVVYEATFWAVLAGLIGGRLYHVITSWDQVTKEWWGPFAIWEGGLGIWGGVLFGGIAAAIVARMRGAGVAELADAAAPGLLVGQAIGRWGNYFNQELFGSPSSLPWALAVDPEHRPDQYVETTTFHPVFLYEMLWNLGLAGVLIWLGWRFSIRPPGLFALYVAGYSLGRVFWEQLRIDPANEFLGQRINFYVALLLMLGALAFFVWNQRRTTPVAPARQPEERSGPKRPKAKAKRVPSGRRR